VLRTPPEDLENALRRAATAGALRVVIAGGDGSVATAAAVLREHPMELAIIPAGTLNHLAKDLGLPDDLDDASRIASGAHVRSLDVGMVGARVFLNTSSVGVYVAFVRLRDRLERYLGYWLASVVAAASLLFRARTFRVTLEVDGQTREYVTPLVFVGVGERELRVPTVGARVPHGRRGLHVMVVRHHGGARLLALALAALARGLDAVARTPALDAFIVDGCRIEPRSRRPYWHIAIDGEIVAVPAALQYSIVRDALRVVVPS
jgi:diacylglycerol kinase family enzyme